MIHIIVGTTHLQELLGHWFHPSLSQAIDEMDHVLDEEVGRKVKSVEPDDAERELSKATVFEILQKFHTRATLLLTRKAPAVIEKQREEIVRIARDEYHLPDFVCTPEDACRSFAIHGVFPHGLLSPGGESAYLPDYSMGVRCIASFAYDHSADRDDPDRSGYQEIRSFLDLVKSFSNGIDASGHWPPEIDKAVVSARLTRLLRSR